MKCHFDRVEQKRKNYKVLIRKRRVETELVVTDQFEKHLICSERKTDKTQKCFSDPSEKNLKGIHVE